MRMTAALLFLFLPLFATAQVELPAEGRYDETLPRPGAELGFEVGEWHARHDQIVHYLRRLAAASPRVTLMETGRSHEQRPLVTLAITSPENQSRLDELREQHRAWSENESEEPGPLVLWFGYSIHGDEASGSNASMLFAYHLAALQEAAHEAMLEDTVILIDPSLNPDGLGRFTQWVNGHRSRQPVADPNNREHVQGWPEGRVNHYWFDLNRDWLLLTHPESRARVSVLQQWRPNVVLDFHEMGSNSTYFFQPGVPERKNPLTPEANVTLTETLAGFHARAFDRIDQLYYSEESFDDFYYGKGSTYPDVQGMIGILFEQASAAGHLIDTDYGPLSFSTAVRNHLVTSLSTLEGAVASARELKDYQRGFHRQALEAAGDQRHRAWLFGDSADPGRSRAMAEILRQHDIDIYRLREPQRINGTEFRPGSAFLVPLQQRQYWLIQALFERRTEFADDTFYDVSAWTFPLAFNLPAEPLRDDEDLRGKRWTGGTEAPAEPGPAYAWAVDWRHYSAPRALQALLDEEIRVYSATKPFTATTAAGAREFPRGTLLVPRGVQDQDPLPLLQRIANEQTVPVHGLESGLTPGGIDLGSPSMERLRSVRPLLVTGGRTSAYEAGEVWHLLDTRIGLPPVMVDADRLDRIDLGSYTHLLLVDGSTAGWDEAVRSRITDWTRAGGIVVATKDASAWATRLLEGDAEKSAKSAGDQESPEAPARRAYGDYSDDYAKTVIGGAILNGRIDLSHPLAYGYTREQLPLFRNGTTVLAASDNPYETVAVYEDTPLLAGYLGGERSKQLAGSAAVLATRLGRGAVLRLPDNPNFRGYWYGTNRLYFNALYLGHIIDATPLADTETRL